MLLAPALYSVHGVAVIPNPVARVRAKVPGEGSFRGKQVARTKVTDLLFRHVVRQRGTLPLPTFPAYAGRFEISQPPPVRTDLNQSEKVDSFSTLLRLLLSLFHSRYNTELQCLASK